MAKRVRACSSCGKEDAPYRCPKRTCARQSCSVQCVQRHKKTLGCDGQRDRAAYVSMGDFNDKNLLSDYFLLEEAAKTAGAATRNPNLKTHKRAVRRRWRELLAQCKDRDTHLELLPSVFARAKANQSVFLFKQKEVRWSVDISFPMARGGAACKTVHRVSERSTWRSILACLVNASALSKTQLQAYVPLDNFALVMKAGGCAANDVRYHHFELGETVGTSLSGCHVVEYPAVTVVPLDELVKFPLASKIPRQHPASVSGGNIPVPVSGTVAAAPASSSSELPTPVATVDSPPKHAGTAMPLQQQDQPPTLVSGYDSCDDENDSAPDEVPTRTCHGKR